MRKFILGANVAYPSAIDAINAGAVGFVGLADDGTRTLITADNAAEYIKKPINIVTVTSYEGTKEILTPFIVWEFTSKRTFRFSIGPLIGISIFLNPTDDIVRMFHPLR